MMKHFKVLTEVHPPPPPPALNSLQYRYKLSGSSARAV